MFHILPQKRFILRIFNFKSYSFFFIKLSCSFQKLSYIQTSFNIQEEIWKQMLFSISGIENKLGMEFGQLVQYKRKNIFQKKHSENRTEKLVTSAIFMSSTGSH